MSDNGGSFGRAIDKVGGHFVLWGTVAFLIGVAIFVSSGLVVVEKGKMAILIHKTGEPLMNAEIIATNDTFKGIQLDPLPEGWHWKNPYSWDWEIVDQLEIRKGEVGVQVRNFGRPLEPGQVIAGDGQKGVLKETLQPGSYRINPFANTVKKVPAITVEAGFMGVVTLVSGRDPKNPNDFLMEPGERGVQKATVPPGTHYINPYIEQILPIDTRSHRFDMTGEKVIHFPSLDGFDISMDGTIEWYIDPQRVADVFV